MQPNSPSTSAVRREALSRATQQVEHGPDVTRSLSNIRRLRSDESWIEVSSQPSSSSLSSAANDDVVTTGLRIQSDNSARRRRRLNSANPSSYFVQGRPTSTAGSSQEEYEESESESDRIMTSSNEGLDRQYSDDLSPPAPISSAVEDNLSEDNDDDDGNSTALGVPTNQPAFTPQPNAFTHPPQATNERYAQSAEARISYFPLHERRVSGRPSAHSYPTQRNRSHTPYNMISPSHQADHDAALRASLSTLLSCAAAARGLSKQEQQTQTAPRPPNRIEPSSLRIVPESVVRREEAARPRTIQRRSSIGSSSEQSARDKAKRKASTSRDRRERRKKRRGSIEDLCISPTLLTWVVSAGVVVLFSAISFSAGYTVGKEVGRIESGIGAGGNGVLCGKEVGKGLRKLRLGTPTVTHV